jgi:hypothetical protein
MNLGTCSWFHIITCVYLGDNHVRHTPNENRSTSDLASMEVSSPFASGASSPVAVSRSLQARAVRMYHRSLPFITCIPSTCINITICVG